MKIIENSPARLVLDHRPWLHGLIAVFFIVLLVWLTGRAVMAQDWGRAAVWGGGIALAAATYVLTERVQVILDLPLGTVFLRRRGLRGHVATQYRLADLRGAVVQVQTPPPQRGAPGYRMALIIGDPPDRAQVLFTRDFDSGHIATPAAQAVNDWMARTGLTTDRPGT